MKIYKTQNEVEKDVAAGVLVVNDSVTFESDLNLPVTLQITGNINAGNIKAGNISAEDINAGDIKAGNIIAEDINAGDINARDIKARDIDARDIDARDIDARDIKAYNIKARNIMYFAFCCVYNSIFCISIKSGRKIHHEPICLDGKLIIKEGVTA